MLFKAHFFLSSYKCDSQGTLIIILYLYLFIFMYRVHREGLLVKQGGISFNTGGSFSTSWMWKMSPGKLPCPRTWNNIKKKFKIPSRNTGGSFSTSRLNFHILAIKKRDTFSVWLFSSCLGEKDSHFCLVYGKVY